MTDQKPPFSPDAGGPGHSTPHETTAPLGLVRHDGDGSARATSSISLIMRNRMFAGLVLLLPAALTAWITWEIGSFLHDTFQGWLKPNLRAIAQQNWLAAWVLSNELILSVGTVLLAILIIAGGVYMVGLLSTAYAVKRAIRLGERVIQAIPVVSFCYNLLKQIMDTIAIQRDSQGKMQRLVIVEYPRRGIYALAFVTGETYVATTGETLVNVFLPTTPNPTSGFLLLLPRDQVYDTNLGMDGGVRFIMSGGILTPQNFHIVQYAPEDASRDLPPAFIPTPDSHTDAGAETVGAAANGDHRVGVGASGDDKPPRERNDA